ncbi:hypothetical protein CsSME_00005206 [Camellia sinensis var. sinensis]
MRHIYSKGIPTHASTLLLAPPKDYIMGLRKILPIWSSLCSILPRKNRGLDIHDHTKPDDDRDHDEL